MMMKVNDEQVFKIAIEFFHFYIGKYLDEQKNPNPLKKAYLHNNGYLMGVKSLTSIYSEIFH